MKKKIGQAFDLRVNGRFVFCDNSLEEVYKHWQSISEGQGWTQINKKAEWERTVPDSVFGGKKQEYAKIIQREWSKDMAERKSYTSNAEIRRKIDSRLKKIAALTASIGTGQKSEKKINKKIDELSKEILKFDPNFLTDIE